MNEIKVGNGDLVHMKKPHPCGGFVWRVIRFGADVKIECTKCNKVVMLDRVKFYKRIKKVLERSESNEKNNQGNN